MSSGQLHEGFSGHGEEKKASEKSLGIVFACVCALVGGLRWYHDHGAFWWFVAAAVFFCLAMFWNAPLKPLNWFWHRLGILLFTITNPIIMGVVFFVAVVPTGLLMRAFGKDPLKMKIDRDAKSYWVVRTPPGPAGHEMSNQF